MVCEWQDSDCFPTVNQWRYENSNWLSVLPSAIKFLSGGCVGELFTCCNNVLGIHAFRFALN